MNNLKSNSVMKKYFIIFTVATAFFASCAKDDSQMERTIFIPDKIDNQLPAYTEWGYNSFGAKIDRKYFVASNNIIPSKILYKDGSLRFSLNGTLNEYSNYWSNHAEYSLTFDFPLEQLHEYTDLLILDNKKIELASSNCVLTSTQYGATQTLNVISGELHFCRAQMLSIDEQPNRVILSGVFDFRYLNGTDEFPVSVSDGRFDFGINKNAFYAY